MASRSVSLYDNCSTNQNSPHDTTSLTASQEVMSDSDSDPYGDLSLTPFPPLTGLKTPATRGERESTVVDSQLTLGQLTSTTASVGASPIAALQAAWAVVLSAYSGAKDKVAFGTVLSISADGKSDESSSDALYKYAIPSYICLRKSQTLEDPTNASVLRRITKSNERAVHDSGPSMTAQRGFQHQSATALALTNGNPREDHHGTSKNGIHPTSGPDFAVRLEIWPSSAGSLKLKASFTNSFLNQPSAGLMLTQMDSVLTYIIANTQRSIVSGFYAMPSSLLSISDEVRESPSATCAMPPLLHSQFETMAKTSPEHVALIFIEDLNKSQSDLNITWTYRKLNQEADYFAMYLNDHFGSLIDKIVPICMKRCPHLYVAVLGILKAGGGWCPIDPSFPASRRHELVARTDAAMLILAEPAEAHGLDGIPRGVIAIDITRLADATNEREERSSPNPSNLAYLIWTSGTTGEPKGVPIHHAAAVMSMRALQRIIPTNVKGDIVRCLQFSQFTFDVFVQDLFYTWGVGGMIISSNREVMLGSFAELASETKATHAHLTPAFAASLLRENCPTLEVITMIGEKLPQNVADDWSRDMRAFNTYGPAETTVVSTFRQFGTPGDEILSSNIGFPLPSVSTFVIRNGHPVMKNGIGELALGGPQLCTGYWKDPVRSSGKFVWNEKLSRNIYMTGDVVRQLHDGSLDFVGRKDDLIKVQGIRIELSEIAFCLRSCHPLVEQIEIQYLNRQDRPSKVIVAFLAAPQIGLSHENVCLFGEDAVKICQSALLEARRSLPGYMIPSVFLVVKSIPRTPSAKVDRTALKDLYGSMNIAIWEMKLASAESDSGATADWVWTSQELAILGCISHVTGTSRESMSRASNLPSLGIDSIGATRLVALLITKGTYVSTANVIGCHNLDDLMRTAIRKPTFPAERFDLEAFHEQWYGKVKTEIPGRDVFIIPTLPLQESLISESMQNVHAYWSNHVFSLNAHVDMTRWRKAWQQLAMHTEALRTGFIPTAKLLAQRTDDLDARLTYLQLVYGNLVLDWKDMQFSEALWKSHATERARAIAERHQRNHFKDPPWAVTIFEGKPSSIMVITIHHSICDDISLHLITENVHRIYTELCSDSGGLVGPYVGLESHAEQFVQLQDALRVTIPSNSQIEQDEKCWAEILRPFADTNVAKTWPDLTGKRNLRTNRSPGFLTHTRDIGNPYRDLQERAINIGASSVASVLRVAFGCVLLEYLESDSVVFAETWSIRTGNPLLAGVVGPLITVLPVPFRAQATPRAILTEQLKFQIEARFHRSVHPRVIRKLLGQPETQALYPAVFNFLPDLIESNTSKRNVPPLWTKVDDFLGITVEHPLAINIAETTCGFLRLEFLASELVMDTEHLALLAKQVESLFATILEFPNVGLDQILSKLPCGLLSISSSSIDGAAIGAVTADPTHWIDHYAAIHPEWLAAQVVSYIDEESVASESWNYAELFSAYTHVAAFISGLGFHKQMIAVCLDRRLEAFAIILGILKSGNTYLPIDEDLPVERKSLLLYDSGAAILFTMKSLADTIPNIPIACRVIRVDENRYGHEGGLGFLAGSPLDTDTTVSVDSECSVNGTSTSKPSSYNATDDAYLLYTSGSTGLPKGVLVGRGSLCSFIEAASQFTCSFVHGMDELAGKGRYLGLASRAFDVHLVEMFLAWRNGMAVVTASRTLLLENLELALRRLEISHAFFVPSLLDHAGLNPTTLPKLRYVSVGGEKISSKVIDTWACNVNTTLVNAYGPTEMTIGCAFKVVTPSTNLRNVGPPLGNTTAHVLVPNTESYTMRGVSGELCLTGDLVANGYHNRPDAKGFVENFNGSRMYRTGDRVRMMWDGSLEFLGRSDDQIKVRGQRLELGEVSEAMRTSSAAILDVETVGVATIVAQHPSLIKPQLVSFVVAPNFWVVRKQGSPVAIVNDDRRLGEKVQDIRLRCRDVVPSYMVPDHIIFITALPVCLTSGKADGKKLLALFLDIPLPDLITPSSPEKLGRPESGRRETTELEKRVRDAVLETLAIDTADMSHNTNLFQLGLDSLSVISLTVRLQKSGFRCTVTSVLRNPTLEALALLPREEHIDGAKEKNLANLKSMLSSMEIRFRATHSHGLDDSSISAVRPCLPLQESLVAATLSNKNDAIYVNHVYLKLSAKIDHSRFYNAWVGVVADHDILRTCFQEFENRVVQVILKYNDPQSLSWNEICNPSFDEDLSTMRLREFEIASEIVSTMACKAPVRCLLLRSSLKDQSTIFAISIHHALYDGESFAMTLDEIYARYQSDVPLQPRTPLSALIHYVSSQDQNMSRNYWKKYLARCKPTTITGGKGSPVDKQSFQKAPLLTKRTLSHRLSELEQLSYSMKGTLASTIQGVFGIVLAQLLGQHEVIFGTVLSGRSVPIENPHTILAPCITTIPQRVNLQRNHSSLFDTLVVAQEGFVKSLEYQHTALRDIHRWIGAEKPLFDSLFSFVRKKKAGNYSHLWHELESSMPNEFPFCIEFEADHEVDQMVAHCVFTCAFGDFDKADTFLESIDLLLGALVRQEDISLTSMAITSSNGMDIDSKPPTLDESQWSPEESKMKALVAHNCGIKPIDISKGASFFSLGIDSITAIHFARCLRRSGIECSSADVMRHSCIAALANHVSAIRSQNGHSKKLADSEEDERLTTWLRKAPTFGPQDAITDAFICTPLQSSMLTQTLASNGNLYVHHHAVRLSNEIDLTHLKRSWECLAAHTEILRSTFHFSQTDGVWLAAVHRERKVDWNERDVAFSAPNPHELLQSFAFREEVDFTSLPWKLTIWKAPKDVVLVLSMHHSLYDGESINLLFDDLATTYHTMNLPPRPSFSEAAREIAKSNADAERFWTRSIFGYEGMASSKLPIGGENSVVEAISTLKMDVDAILAACRDLGVTLQTVALLAVGKGLASASERRDIVFGHVVRGRSLALRRADEVVGPLFNTIPFRFTIDKAYITNGQAASEIQRLTGDSQAYQHASLGKIQQLWRKGGVNDNASLFDAIFLFQNRVGSQNTSSSLWMPLEISGAVADTEYPINIEFEQTEQEITVRVASHGGLIYNEHAPAWLIEFEEIFQDILEHPSRSVIAFPDFLRRLPPKFPRRPKESPQYGDIESGPDLDCIHNTLSEISGLSLESIALSTSIFSIGIDSISAIKVAAACRSKGYNVSVADVLQGQSLGDICRLFRAKKSVRDGKPTIQNSIVSADARSKAISLVNAHNEDVEDVLPCLAGQVYHLASWLKSGRTLCEPIWTYACRDRLNAQVLLSAWRALREHHTILRTQFVGIGPKQIVQVVLNVSTVDDSSFQCLDAPGSLADAAMDTYRREAMKPFDLFTAPCQLYLIRGADQDCVFMKLHHATYDAWTIPTLIADLEALYRKINLTSVPAFKLFIQRTFQSLQTDQQKDYWTRSLRDSQPTLLKPAHAKARLTTNPKPTFVTLKDAIPNLQRLTTTLQTSEISPPTLLLLAFARTLARHTAIPNPIFGLYQTGRSASFDGINKLCAPCLNVTPLCVPGALSQDPHAAAQAIQSNLAARVPFEQSYLHDILEWVGSPHQPLFNTYVNILWHEGADVPSKDESDDLLQPWQLASWEDLTPTEPIPGKTAVDGLDVGILAEGNLFLDVMRENGDAVDFVIRCDYGLMGREEVRRFAGEVVQEVEKVLEMIGIGAKGEV
ncbi:hypothetical protein N7G274_008136 [Stereocaulon virgatum]|uniref:Carrier domain-containing protein n=1 Tax=Stereocaulon virgatum TaxID=373712 RepID=A0ABR3ZZG9_9LECA